MGLISGLMGNAASADLGKLREQYSQLFAEGETLEAGFVVIRETFLFTNRRLILVDVQGVTGSKVAYLSIPYGKITKYSVETAGMFELDADLKIWVGSDPEPIACRFSRQVDVYALQRVLAQHA
ncbi:PH domain-containing protein [Sphaerotilus microaerophilus]|uniref:Bacterial Pleckstrin homology domain-containing protein n=1 Tax=Sphaerotilus microaerophilus TaxID=2914710 RepID=A0ABM7YTF9_9BURK|nr:PH domain-containing protein [Sphaerotilus sp. FB-5]BDI07942.1 hypothetical protein CATMQ487_49120 [Sphaerotilus sp. FB-5]